MGPCSDLGPSSFASCPWLVVSLRPRRQIEQLGETNDSEPVSCPLHKSWPAPVKTRLIFYSAASQQREEVQDKVPEPRVVVGEWWPHPFEFRSWAEVRVCLPGAASGRG